MHTIGIESSADRTRELCSHGRPANFSHESTMTHSQQDHPLGRLFEDYLAKAHHRPKALEVTATRTESRGLRDVFAYGASRGQHNSEELNSAVLAGEVPPMEPKHLASLARVRALQNFDEDDRPFAIAAFAIANPLLPQDKSALTYRQLEVQLLLDSGDFERVAELLRTTHGLRKHPELLADLQNPFTASPYADADEWAKNFNQRLVRLGYEPVSVAPGDGLPFDRLTAVAPEARSTGLISVIMTTYRPERHAFLGSIKSILRQTWPDIELIVVDDASPSEFDSVLDEASRLDERITLVRLSENRGTYAARNRGLALARGALITGQDDDDWSHPRRLELQARILDEEHETPAVRVASLPAHANLTRSRVGYGYLGENSSSLMFRAEWRDAVGGHLPVRKAADNEFHHRLEAVSGQRVRVLRDPLTIVRVAPDSLSRSDYRAGWSHPARRAFRSAYTLWHARSKDLWVDPLAPPPIPVPRRFEIQSRAREKFDVVFAGDWRQYGGPQRSMLEEIAALLERGLRVGVLHLEAARFMSEHTKPLCRPIQNLINSGQITEVLADDEDDVRIMVLRYPPILQFASAIKSTLRIQQLFILADQAPSERDGSDIRYRTVDCTRNATELFGLRPVWVPQGPTTRQILETLLPAADLAPFDMPGILKLEDWRSNRTVFRSTVPVIGRHSRDNAMKWPADPAVLRKVYPTDGSVDVRIMGGGDIPRAVLDEPYDPPAWLVFETDALPVKTFLNSIDYFVYYQHDAAYDAFGRATLEAIAAGCVAVLPPFLEATFGEAAVYATAEEAIPLVRELYADPETHWQQVAKSAEVLRARFSYPAYADQVAQLLNHSKN